MTARPLRTSKTFPKRSTARARRSDPAVPAAAKRIEKDIAGILRRLVAAAHPTCLDKKFVDGYTKVLNLFAAYQREVLEAYPHMVSCNDKCGTCCNHWPEDTYSFEVQIIADYLKKNRPGDINRITETLREDMACLDRIKTAVRKRLLDPHERAALGDIDPYDVALSSFYRFNRPCPLLDKNGSCSIYPIRPFTCRVYVSFSPPEYCRPGRILGDKVMTYLLDLEKDASELFDRLHFMYDVFDGETWLRAMLYKVLTK
jgi:Fe-S-cluster containining protein